MRVPHLAFGAIVVAVAGEDVILEVDPILAPASFGVGDATVVAHHVMLKGQGEARHRFLDDARNAPKLGTAVRDQLRTQWPEIGDAVARRHAAWSKAFVREILGWSRALATVGLRGKRVRDPDGRIYLLQWAGATVTDDGMSPPAALHDAPSQPAAATPEAYRDYVRALVDALR